MTWGDAEFSGDCNEVADQLAAGVTAVYSTDTAFAALKVGGEVVTWGQFVDSGTSIDFAGRLAADVTADPGDQGAPWSSWGAPWSPERPFIHDQKSGFLLYSDSKLFRILHISSHEELPLMPKWSTFSIDRSRSGRICA